MFGCRNYFHKLRDKTFVFSQGGTMVTYGGMSKKPITVSTSSFIFKVSPDTPVPSPCCQLHLSVTIEDQYL